MLRVLISPSFWQQSVVTIAFPKLTNHEIDLSVLFKVLKDPSEEEKTISIFSKFPYQRGDKELRQIQNTKQIQKKKKTTQIYIHRHIYLPCHFHIMAQVA